MLEHEQKRRLRARPQAVGRTHGGIVEPRDADEHHVVAAARLHQLACLIGTGRHVHFHARALHEIGNGRVRRRQGIRHEHALDACALPEVPGGLLLGDAQLQIDPEERPFPHLAFHLDGAAHEIDEALGDGHAEARPLHFVGGGVLGARERVEDSLKELRRHAVAIVLNLDAQMLQRIGMRRKPDEAQPDATALRSVLHSIRQ